MPTLFVMGSAERLVTPDRVRVSVSVQTPVLRTAPEALARAAEARRRLLDHVAASLPGVAVSDGRYLTYLPSVGRLGVLSRQPPGDLVGLARGLQSATSGHVP